MNIPRRLARIQALEAAAGANDQLTVTVTHVIVGEGPREAYVFTLDGVPTPEPSPRALNLNETATWSPRATGDGHENNTIRGRCSVNLVHPVSQSR